MTDPAWFTVADLRSQAGDEAFRAAGEHVVAIDGPDEDEWSLYATLRLDDGRTLETILHHRVGGSLVGECDCPQGLAGSFCSHLVLVGLATLASTRQQRPRRSQRPRPSMIFASGWPP
jgi:hypothetical protein